jgi:hypothetical protein
MHAIFDTTLHVEPKRATTLQNEQEFGRQRDVSLRFAQKEAESGSALEKPCADLAK